VEPAGYLPVALSPDDYIELLPACWRAVNAYGIKISRRCYDCEQLNPLRLQPSRVAVRKDLWEVHHDPLSQGRDNGSYADLGVIPIACRSALLKQRSVQRFVGIISGISRQVMTR
jgi:hypothetical protein